MFPKFCGLMCHSCSGHYKKHERSRVILLKKDFLTPWVRWLLLVPGSFAAVYLYIIFIMGLAHYDMIGGVVYGMFRNFGFAWMLVVAPAVIAPSNKSTVSIIPMVVLFFFAMWGLILSSPFYHWEFWHHILFQYPLSLLAGGGAALLSHQIKIIS